LRRLRRVRKEDDGKWVFWRKCPTKGEVRLEVDWTVERGAVLYNSRAFTIV